MLKDFDSSSDLVGGQGLLFSFPEVQENLTCWEIQNSRYGSSMCFCFKFHDREENGLKC